MPPLPRSKTRSLITCKFPLLKLAPPTILFVTLLTFVYSPEVYDGSPLSVGATSRWIRGGSDSRYLSEEDVNWDDISKQVDEANEGNGFQGIGLLNFNHTEIHQWRNLLPEADHAPLQLEPVAKNLTWDSLYPEWIDEEQDEEVPVCPSLPRIDPPRRRLDLIAVKLPCRNQGNWSRDVARIHLQLAAAGVAASSKGFYSPHLLFVSRCFPMPTLFPCKELVGRRGRVWLYRPDLNRVRARLQLPVGSCELALPLEATKRVNSGDERREAYATILHSADVYVCGAIAAARSIRMVGSRRDMVILADDTIGEDRRRGLEAAGWKVRTIERIRNPRAEREAYNEWNYSKFRLWQLTEYERIVFIDADMLVLRNIDFLFGMPEISATGNNASLFNSGVMVIEPSNCTFRLLMDHIREIESYNGGDQGYLNEVFAWWHRIPRRMNFLKHFWAGDGEERREMKTRLFAAEPAVLYVLHFLGVKPWLCFRDYDCNWNVDFMQEFASDAAHERWWRVHDAMPAELRRFCMLGSRQKAGLEWERRRAERGNYTDAHWRIRIRDPRLKACVDDVCSWKGMLRHWGETNRSTATSPLAGRPSFSPSPTNLTRFSGEHLSI